MKIQVTEVSPYGSPVLVAVVDSRFTTATEGRRLIERIEHHFPTHPIMLVSIEASGFRAYAPFQTHVLLALLQLEYLDLRCFELPEPQGPQWPRPTPHTFVRSHDATSWRSSQSFDRASMRLALKAEAELPF